MKALHAILQGNFTQLYQQEYNKLLKHISLTRQHIIIIYDMCTEGYGLDILSYLTQLALIIAGFAFADDTDNINAAKSVNKK